MLAIAGLFPGRTTPRSQKHSLSFEWANHLTTTIAGDVLDPSREQGEVEAIELARGAEARASGGSSSCPEAPKKSCPLDRLVWEVNPLSEAVPVLVVPQADNHDPSLNKLLQGINYVKDYSFWE